MDPWQRRIEDFLRKWLGGILPPYLFKILLHYLQKMAPWIHTMIPVKTISCRDSPPPDRWFQYAKWLVMLIRFLLFFVYSRINRILGYCLVDTTPGNLIPEETKKQLINPPRQGSQRNHDNLGQKKNWCWVKAIQAVLPDEDDSEDSTYEPSTTDYESSDKESQNYTETDLESEEEDGVIILQKQPEQQDDLNGQAEPQELRGRELELRSSGNGSELPVNTATSGSGWGQALGSQAEGMATRKQKSSGRFPAAKGPDPNLSSDSEEQ